MEIYITIMVKLKIQPSRFILPGACIEARFIGEDDKLEWYKGTVLHINSFGENKTGTYVDCSVRYEDGEVVEDTILEDKDFNKENHMDAWRFDGVTTMLVSYINKHAIEIEALKEKLETCLTKKQDYDTDENEEEDTEEDEDYDIEEDTEEDTEEDEDYDTEEDKDPVGCECSYCNPKPFVHYKKSYSGLWNMAMVIAAIANIGVMVYTIVTHGNSKC